MPIRPPTPPRPAPGVLRHWTLWAWFVLALILMAGGVCLWRSGRWLVHDDAFGHARWALVLAGESRDCERTDAAVRMFQEGRFDSLIISGTRIFKNRYQCEFLADYAAAQGVPRGRIFEFRQDAYSTQEEAALLIPQFRLQNLDTVVIITSSFHTARTRRIFRKLAQGYPEVLVASADYALYDPSAWWTNRESLKIWLTEWAKTIFSAYELWRARPVSGKAEFQGLIPDPALGADSVESGPANRKGGTEGTSASQGTALPQEGSAVADSAATEALPPGAVEDSAAAEREVGASDSISADGRGGAAQARKDSVSGEAKTEKRIEAPKAAVRAEKKPPAPKPAPKREEKKTEKTRKKG